ncbi:MAG: LamG-like jellyroll fold domain-containing protein [Pirellulales bacterium]
MRRTATRHSSRPSQRRRVLICERMEARRLLVSDWRNPVDSLDIDGNHQVAPLDALTIINELNAGRSGALTAPHTASAPYLDATGDHFVTALDALYVINQLNHYPNGNRTLAGGSFVSETDVTVTLGQTTGRRQLQVQINTQFDSRNLPDEESDLLSVYLLDPNTGQTLVDAGQSGSALFSLTSNTSRPALGLVNWNGSVLTIDVSQVNSVDTGLLRFQLLSRHANSTSQVQVIPLGNDIDDAVPGELLDPAPAMAPGSALNAASLTTQATLGVEFSQVGFDSKRAKYGAAIRVLSHDVGAGKQLAVLFPGLPNGVTLANASGDLNGVPYLNVNPSGGNGLGANAAGPWIQLLINDPNQTRFVLKPTVIGNSNHAPTLPSIGSLSVSPGGTLSVPFQATDVDGDDVAYSLVSTTPLPNVTLRDDGQLIIQPTVPQIGSYAFDVIAGDSSASTRQHVTLQVSADPNSNTRVAGKVLNLDQSPIVSVKVEIGNAQGLTDSEGKFELDLGTAPVVTDTIRIRGELIVGKSYPFIAEKLPLLLEHDLIDHVNNVIVRPIYLPLIDTGNAMSIDPLRDTTVTTNAIPGASVFVASGTLMNQQGSPFTGALSMTTVPTSLTPAAVPNNLNPSLVVTIQPGDMSFAVPAPLSLPNVDGMAPGTLMDLWSINPSTGAFDKVGVGKVSDDGKVVNTISGGIHNSSWHFFGPPSPNPPRPNDPRNPGVSNSSGGGGGSGGSGGGGGNGNGPSSPTGNSCPSGDSEKAAAASVCEMSTGSHLITHELVGYSSDGTDRSLSLSYSSLRADSRPIIHFATDNLDPNTYSVPSAVRLVANLSVSHDGMTRQVPGFSGAYGFTSGANFFRLQPDAGSADAALQVDLSDQPTGIFDYTLYSGMLGYAGSVDRYVGTSVKSTGQVLNVNTIDSPYGAGWGIHGLKELVVAADGTVIVLDGDATELVYTKNSDGSYRGPAGCFITLEKLGDGTFQRSYPDKTIEHFGANQKLLTVTDRYSNVTQYQYDAQGRLLSVTDPVGLATTIAYTVGNVTITAPGNHVTRLSLDSQNNLIQVTDPDGSAESFSYDNKHHVVKETDQLGNFATAKYGFHGRLTGITMKDGTERSYIPSETIGLYPPEQTAADPRLAGDQNPLAKHVGNVDAKFVESNGNVLSTKLNGSGQAISQRDSVGSLPTVLRDNQNMPVETTDGRGNKTVNTFDSRGNLLSSTSDLGTDSNPFSQAVQFNGIDDGVSIPDAAFLHSPNISVELWARFDAIPQFANMIGKTVGGGFSDSYDIWFFNGSLNGGLSRNDSSIDVLRTPFAPILGHWYHFAFSFNDSTKAAVLYVDGEQVAYNLFDGSIVYDTHPTLIGKENDNGAETGYFPGAIDDVRIWGTVRSKAEIQQNFTKPLKGDEPGLLAYYSFDAFDGISVSDATNHHLDGTASGSAISSVNAAITITDSIAAPANMVAWWTGDQNSNDIVGSHNGALQHGFSEYANGTTYAPAEVGLGFQFDGANDVDIIPHSNDLSITGDLTIDAWVLPTVFAGAQRTIVSKRDNDGRNITFVFFFEPDGTLKFGSLIANGTFSSVSADVLVPLNDLSHVAVAVSGSTVKFYIDGKDAGVKTLAISRPSSNGPLSIGGTVASSTLFAPFAGVIDEVHLFSRALAASEILAIAQTGRSGIAKPTIYDVARDYDLMSNPNGSWSYGYIPENSTTIVPMAQVGSNDRYSVRYGLNNGPDALHRNTLDSFIQHNVPPVDMVNMDPSISGLTSIIQWKAPVSGDFLINGRFETVDMATVHVEAYLNNDSAHPFVAADLTSFSIGVIVPFAKATHLTQGDVVTFLMSNISQVTFDGTGLSATIVQVGSSSNTNHPQQRLSATDTYTYDPVFNRMTSHIDPEGRKTLFDIDSVTGNLNAVREVVGTVGGTDDRVTSYTYKSNGQVASITDALGRITQFEYDTLGRLTSKTSAKGTAFEGMEHWEYDTAGDMSGYVDRNGNRTQYAYDSMRRISQITAADNSITAFGYDSRGNLISTTDAAGNETKAAFDTLDRLITITDAAGNKTRRAYDVAGNLIRITDPLGHSTQMNYDVRNRVRSTIDASGAVTQFVYDADDELISVIDGDGNRTQTVYDAVGRVTRVIDPLGANTSFSYDKAGLLLRKVDRLGRSTEYSYDELRQLTTETWQKSDGTPVDTLSYAYDAVGNQISAGDVSSTNVMSYNVLDWLDKSEISGPNGLPSTKVTYGYDLNGNLRSYSDTINGVVGPSTITNYDSLNRASRIMQFGGGTSNKRVDFAYDATGNLRTLTRTSDLTGQSPVAKTTYSYDIDNRLTSIKQTDPNSQTIDQLIYAYDAASRIVQITDRDGLSNYQYDSRNELTSATHADAAVGNEGYSYDATGNRLSSTKNGSAYRTSAGNRLTTDGVFNFTYDAEGNLTRRTEIATGKWREFQYDHRNRMVKFIDRDASGAATQFGTTTYDVFDRRIAAMVDTTPGDANDGSVTYFVYSGIDIIADVIDADGSGTGSATVATRYLHGPAIDEVLAQESAGSVEWMLTDHLGTVRDLINNQGQVVNHFKYDSYGNLVFSSDPTGHKTRYHYTGRELDAATGMQYNRARYYDSSTGRFISQDPKGLAAGDPNLYAYVSNSPIEDRDPSGLAKQHASYKDNLSYKVAEAILQPLASAIKKGEKLFKKGKSKITSAFDWVDKAQDAQSDLQGFQNELEYSKYQREHELENTYDKLADPNYDSCDGSIRNPNEMRKNRAFHEMRKVTERIQNALESYLDNSALGKAFGFHDKVKAGLGQDQEQ